MDLQIVDYGSDGVSVCAALRRDKLEFCDPGAGFSTITPARQYSNAPKSIKKNTEP